MSLYNMTQGVDRFAKAAIATLHQPDVITENINFGRIRDAFFEKDGDEYRIRVHTRNGGGNRSDYRDEINELRGHPWFRFDEDCSHDNTYADFVFMLPENIVTDINEQLKETEIEPDELWSDPVDHQARFQAVLDNIAKATQPPE